MPSTTTRQFRVAIVDPQPIFRVGLAHILGQEPDFSVVGVGGTGADALRLVENERPDLLFLDTIIAGGGLQTAVEAKRISKQPLRVMFLTSSESPQDVMSALQVGVAGYMLKGISPETLLQTLRMINEGETYITPQLANRLLIRSQSKAGAETAAFETMLGELTVRDRDILRELATGQTNKEIALKLSISEKTVKHYMGRVLQKLCVRNRTEAVILSQKLGLQLSSVPQKF